MRYEHLLPGYRVTCERCGGGLVRGRARRGPGDHAHAAPPLDRAPRRPAGSGRAAAGRVDAARPGPDGGRSMPGPLTNRMTDWLRAVETEEPVLPLRLLGRRAPRLRLNEGGGQGPGPPGVAEKAGGREARRRGAARGSAAARRSGSGRGLRGDALALRAAAG